MSLLFALPTDMLRFAIMPYLPLADLGTLLTVSHASEGHATSMFSLPPTHQPHILPCRCTGLSRKDRPCPGAAS